MQMQLSKIPSVVGSLNLPSSVEVGTQIVPEEGAVILVEALADEGKNKLLEYASGRIGSLMEGDIIPAVLGKRRALREYSGDIPAQVAVGDILYFLCESGVVGEIRGINEQWGVPMQVRVLGSIVSPSGQQLNIKDFAIARQQQLPASAPIIGVVGTCMNIGKTTAICKLIKHFKSQGLKVAGVKLSGVASTQDLDKIKDAGAAPVYGFMDGGLPSTCGDATEVVEVAMGILQEANLSQPDLIIAEFGDGILGEYNVDSLIKCKEIQQHVCGFIVGAGDLVSAWGAKEIMAQYGVQVTMITGPAVNNDTGVLFVEKNVGVPAESNQYTMQKTIRLLEEKLHIAQSKLAQTVAVAL
ncbi:hypothetical protein EPA93_12410 [Ktedonosporobacter rubrisoli]|uniref:DUF1611 domain-containing protein n=1 Tax=Ktedonosporobacter rubrisoli TaxID=2509675 RepID=A0A4P6JNF1_KTERU|nr:hypothetical protein [Ktedonosporobacter rubrisoli]QBD76765.1 hypothetical protein EPA93_12410 [Ktedonosporobacter rubrisoli]